ncbi:titin homolog [Punica granatum]|uniref:Titin homolog n=2 Tax=Punica granatum TaxID=22663 RepID=A0A6P8EE77_PUNGR|nr:titin homolog [Punica granatum]XP_031405205.1 titin homolog [Punica granatum]OWM78351.1 hypothetical protein CDL15_Pgr016075 [Punica granatum]PKI58884.1 hypothetical protein CRG98_020723 [Punica granatum]
MTKPPENSGEDEAAATIAAWGTWDELLLACAVQRHGFKAWDSVASEVQSRTSLPLPLTTPHHCQLKYHDLHRRFSADDDENDSAVPWLDELRKVRVAELRQEVQRYDVSILSLQLKVKKLEEEREESLREDQQQPDLPEESKPARSGNDSLAAGGETGASLPEKTAAKSAAGEESDRENRSVNGSNSTGVKSEREKAGREAEPKTNKREEEDGEEPVRAGTGSSEKTDQASEESKPEGMDSYNGSSEPNRERRGEEEESDELRDSVAQSKENSSDVQSSASLTRRKKRKGRRVNEISCGGEVAETDDGSPAADLAGKKSQPLVDFLKMIRAHKHSCFFERRLAVQESDKYQNIIRQHTDIDTIQSKLRKGSYSSTPLSFFRDLLLLFDNALVFYPKSSPESATALELHRLVSAELHKKIKKPTPRSSSTQDAPVRPKPELERSDSLLAKHKSSVPIIVCRKRSSFSAKPSSTAMGQKGEPRSEDKRPASDPKQQQQQPQPNKAGGQEQQNLPKINNTVERSVTGARSLRRSNTNLKSSNASTSTTTTTTKKSPLGSTTDKAETPKTDQKKTEGAAASTKKRSAADFLKRIKRNSPAGKSKNTAGDPKNSQGGGGGGSGNGDQKKKQSGKGDKGEERASRQSGGGSSGAKHTKEDSSPSKRSVGRPPKKGGDSNAVAGKRIRDSGGGKEVAVAAALKRPRKRTRR